MRNKTIIKKVEIIKNKDGETMNVSKMEFDTIEQAMIHAEKEVMEPLGDNIEVAESDLFMRYTSTKLEQSDSDKYKIKTIAFQHRAGKHNENAKFLTKNNEFLIFHVIMKTAYDKNKELNNEKTIQYLIPRD